MKRSTSVSVLALVVTAIAEVALAVAVNAITQSTTWAIGAVLLTAFLIHVGARWLSDQLIPRTEVDLRPVIDSIENKVPFSPRLRPRDKALSDASAWSVARRQVRLTSAGVRPEQVPAVLGWMLALDEPVTDVPTGALRVLVAPMGAGKTEQALRWWDEGLKAAYIEPDLPIPVWLEAKRVVESLETSIIGAIGNVPEQPCRVVLDNLDAVSPSQAQALLNESRQLVIVWPKLSIVATSRPGLRLQESERVKVAPWESRRGKELVELVLGRELPFRLSSPESSDLLGSPLLCLAMATRLDAGGDLAVSRFELLSDLPRTIINREIDENATADAWHGLALLACQILNTNATVRAESFGNEAEIRQLTATRLAVEEDGMLSFALPLFEQHFGAQAITTGLVRLDNVATGVSCTRWRYAIASAVAIADMFAADTMLGELAQANPGAAAWVLAEIASDGAYTREWKHADLRHIRESFAPGEASATDDDLAVWSGTWLRQAEKAFLIGFPPDLRPKLAHHVDGQLAQWGVWLDGPQITLAQSHQAGITPEVIPLTTPNPETGLRAEWYWLSEFQFPDSPLGRWHWARKTIGSALEKLLRGHSLPVAHGSILANERLWLVAQTILRLNAKQRHEPISAAALRSKIAEMLESVAEYDDAAWQWGGGLEVDLADLKWLSDELDSMDLGSSGILSPPWPGPDAAGSTGRYVWDPYTPELALRMTTEIHLQAFREYKALVDFNFENTRSLLGLYGRFPLRMSGGIVRSGKETALYSMIEARHAGPNVDDVEVTLSDMDELPEVTTSPGVSLSLSRGLPIHHKTPVTNIVYGWLASDLHEIGLVSRISPRRI